MKITRVEAFPIHAPRAHRFVGARAALTFSDFALVIVETDAGITGYGEVSSALYYYRLGQSHALDINAYLGPALLGEDPLHIPALVNHMDAVLSGGRQAKSGVEMALWDIAGKAAGLPVYRLLGGKSRDAVPLNWTIGQQEPQEMADEAALYLEKHRVRSIRLKIGRPGDTDMRACEAVRKRVGPGITMRLDANEYYRSPKEAIAAIRRLECFDLQLVEQPLAARDFAGHAEVRAAVSVPIGLDESIQSPRDALHAVGTRAGDVFNVYVSESGGLLRSQQIIAIAEAAGIPCLIGTMGELQLASAAAVHLAVACANILLTCDLVGPLRYNESIIEEPLRIEDGLFYPPEAPGLGVTPNWDVINRWRV
ncbi:MAG: mandelate racemase/muconate lactonizing enzyme family protein [Bryobacteraceae bacterium]